MQDFTIYPLGDGVLTITFGNVMDEDVNKKVLHLFHRLKNSALPLSDVVPAYSSLTVYYDVLSLHSPHKSAFEQVKGLLLPFLGAEEKDQPFSGRSIKIPVCYAVPFAFDLVELAEAKNLSVEDVIHLHTVITYRVYMIGFLPGFPYMGKVDEKIATGRRSSPRTGIPAGSVGIAGEQTGIYSLASPGGWNIIGRTPVPLFNKEAKEPVLLLPGDNVTFFPITENEFENYQSRLA